MRRDRADDRHGNARWALLDPAFIPHRASKRRRTSPLPGVPGAGAGALSCLQLVVAGRGDRQDRADRLDPERRPVRVNEPDHHLARQSSSAFAKSASLRISLACFSSRFPRSRSFSSWRSSVVSPSHRRASRPGGPRAAGSPPHRRSSPRWTRWPPNATDARPGVPRPPYRASPHLRCVPVRRSHGPPQLSNRRASGKAVAVQAGWGHHVKRDAWLGARSPMSTTP